MGSIPAFILDPLFGAYTKGAAAVAAVRDAGGWDAVGSLYKNPPVSTEQILHPVEKLIIAIATTRSCSPSLPYRFHDALAGFSPIDHDVIGEMTMAVYFKNWNDPTPADEVTGWGGDRYAAFEVGRDALVAVLADDVGHGEGRDALRPCVRRDAPGSRSRAKHTVDREGRGPG